MNLAIRPETPADIRAIERLTADAFLHAPHRSGSEQFIVDALRRAGQLSLSLVALEDGELPGVPAEYFQALALGGNWAQGEVSYHAAFDATA
jgi:predicted N-acetyltransferase YhbS